MPAPDKLHIGIAGAGLLGRVLAWRWASAGHRVEVFDPSPDGQPALADRRPSVQQAAALTAAGMLSPIAELDNAEPAVAAMGWTSIALWRAWAAQLQLPAAALQLQGSLLLAHRSDLGAAQRVLQRIQQAQQDAAWQAATPGAAGVQALRAEALRHLEPSLEALPHAWMLGGEGALDPVAWMQAMLRHSLLLPQPVQWHWGQSIQAVTTDGHLHGSDGRQLRFDVVVDARGVGATAIALDEGRSSPVRGVRGETIWLHAPSHGLRRPVRLLHPRYRVYVVPRSAELVFVGASEIETQDYSPASLRSVVELLTAAHSVLPGLAESRIIGLDSNCRPATPDNNPVALWQGQRLQINGLFRHGWLLAPALVQRAMQTAPFEGGAV